MLNLIDQQEQKVAQLINLYYICSMKRKIITYGGYFEAFKETLTDKEQDKIDYCLLLLRTQDRVLLFYKG